MWKLLIADDEPKIRRGLRKILPWEEWNIEVVGEAENGKEALELCRGDGGALRFEVGAERVEQKTDQGLQAVEVKMGGELLKQDCRLFGVLCHLFVKIP